MSHQKFVSVSRPKSLGYFKKKKKIICSTERENSSLNPSLLRNFIMGNITVLKQRSNKMQMFLYGPGFSVDCYDLVPESLPHWLLHSNCTFCPKKLVCWNRACPCITVQLANSGVDFIITIKNISDSSIQHRGEYEK